MNPSPSETSSPLERPDPAFVGRPYFDLTVRLLAAVRDHDFEALAELCDDDHGIVDIDPGGSSRVIRSRAEWEDWFHTLFAQLEAFGAATDSEVLAYDAVETDDLGYSVVEFRQFLTVAGDTATFDCITTIVWKRTAEGWREARWHGSVVAADVPEAMAELIG